MALPSKLVLGPSAVKQQPIAEVITVVVSKVQMAPNAAPIVRINICVVKPQGEQVEVSKERVVDASGAVAVADRTSRPQSDEMISVHPYRDHLLGYEEQAGPWASIEDRLPSLIHRRDVMGHLMERPPRRTLQSWSPAIRWPDQRGITKRFRHRVSLGRSGTGQHPQARGQVFPRGEEITIDLTDIRVPVHGRFVHPTTPIYQKHSRQWVNEFHRLTDLRGALAATFDADRPCLDINPRVSERLRRKAQTDALASGEAEWTTELDMRVRIKVAWAWDDAISALKSPDAVEFINEWLAKRTVKSLGKTLNPAKMRVGKSGYTNDELLSLIEAEHEILSFLADQAKGFGTMHIGGWDVSATDILERFECEVNRAFEAHLVGFHLHRNSRLVPIESHELHSAVVAPTLYLLNCQPRFAGSEKAYQNSLRELRNGDAADAITDAATTLQEILTALGCEGNVLGALIKSAKKKGLFGGADVPLSESIVRAAEWVAAQRNNGEAHRGDPGLDISDAWTVVHVVGALAIRLSESDTRS